MWVSMRRCALLLFLCPLAALAAHPKACVPAAEAAALTSKDVCIEAHVYDVVELPDGTRFLDVCPPETPDSQCQFTVISLREDRDQVGELRQYRNADVHLRGIVQPMHGRSGMMLSHARQFNGGPPKFKPNPNLLRGFTGEQSKPPISDPNLRSHGGHRSFMNTHDQQSLAR
jgi:hypothetical protein